MSRPRQSVAICKSARRRAATSTKATASQLFGKRFSTKVGAQKFLRDHGFQDLERVLAAVERLDADALYRRNLRKIFHPLIRACEKSADPDRALVSFERLVAALPNPNIFYHYLYESPAQLDLLITVFAHSAALAQTLTRNAEHLHFFLAPRRLETPRSKAWLTAELTRLLLPIRVPEQKYDAIRRFRRRETLRIGARDLIGRATVEETTLELSNLAEVCLQAVFDIALESLRASSKLTGDAVAASGRFAIIGMGKLGGQELNYSSDVDVIFVYGDEGNLTPMLTNHQFFTRLAEEIIRAVGAPSAEGNIFRIDLRLRPEGKSGPLARSLESCENYYAEFGETWERMALIKARPVAGDPAIGAAFVDMVQPFVYARHASGNVVQQMALLKKRIEEEVVREGHLTRHVKLGIGGIREIEFIVQSFQVLRGARLIQLRDRSTLRALAALVRVKTLTAEDAAALADAYRFLRNVEHRLQMEMDLQTHTIPDQEHALYRLARSLGFDSVKKFLSVEGAHTSAVRRIYESILASAGDRATQPTEALLSPDKLPKALADAGLANVPAAVKVVENLWHGPGFGHVSQRTKELFVQLFAMLLQLTPKLADPDTALAQFDKFITAYGSRGLLYEILASNPKLVEMLVRLGDASRYLSDALARQPELFDGITSGVMLSDPKSLPRMCEELWAAQEDGSDPVETARHWKRSELVRLGIEDVMGLADLEQTHSEMTTLAEACLRFALEHSRANLKAGGFPFAIIGMGKFGGAELGYGADLDVLFVGGSSASDQPDAIKLASRVIDFMGRQTRSGNLFVVDARLRPDGEKGTLAGSLEAHRDYYGRRAQLWERQALLKARLVAGDAQLGRDFIRMTHDYLYGRSLTSGELEEIKQMRHRIETERGDQRHPEWEFKTGPGGLIDVEFIVQALQLRHGHAHPQLRIAHTLAALNRLTALGIVDENQSAVLRRNYIFLREIESALRRVENVSVSRIPSDPREQQFLAKRLGFPNIADFLASYQLATKQTRAIYDSVMSGA
ncbi:MAG TPA: bifunctional [glutamate--ammonia ligase]-adenylyl-L-tyrosine phosphorylase/[glutamate--ammonia-ligase] adenylyltransferase [Verrucomicrobiae bacterium]|nr:bifunctional [glutamate--ammonia ligase]-adenylyl-L-tyrosine phosphorylase/[glutamate--ammonia-ligase] adenylyltransferase [Verrucomicrobiae bacterium]